MLTGKRRAWNGCCMSTVPAVIKVTSGSLTMLAPAPGVVLPPTLDGVEALTGAELPTGVAPQTEKLELSLEEGMAAGHVSPLFAGCWFEDTGGRTVDKI